MGQVFSFNTMQLQAKLINYITFIYLFIYLQGHIHSRARTNVHPAYTHTDTHMHTRTRTHIRIFTKVTHTCTHTYTYAHTNAHTHTHILRYTHMHSHIHYTHTHTKINSCSRAHTLHYRIFDTYTPNTHIYLFTWHTYLHCSLSFIHLHTFTCTQNHYFQVTVFTLH